MAMTTAVFRAENSRGDKPAHNIPQLILGLSLLLLYKTASMSVLPGLFIAHVVVCLPYSFRSILTSLQSFDTTLEEAGQSLGAGPIRSFVLITVPIIWPGVLSGWLFAFVASFGELNTALFLTEEPPSDSKRFSLQPISDVCAE